MNMTEWEAVLALPVAPDRDHIRGPLDAPVALVEYGDYECPYCGAAHSIVNAIQARMGDQLCFVYRHFPADHHASFMPPWRRRRRRQRAPSADSGRCTT